MLHAANNLVSLGRSIGLRIVMISQRPAKLHKDSLTQVETLVAMRVIAPQDRKAIDDWIGEWADRDQGKDLVASLPSLPTGDAWIWSPEAGVLKRAHFPLASTYDSGRAPTGEDGAPELQPLDLEAVTVLLDKAAADIQANDPKLLKGEVARLQRELTISQNRKGPDWPDQREITEALRTELGEARGQVALLSKAIEDFNDQMGGVWERWKAPIGEIMDAQNQLFGTMSEARLRPIGRPNSPGDMTIFDMVDEKVGGVAGACSALNAERTGREPRSIPAVTAGETALPTGPQRHLLEALAWWAAMGHEAPSRAQLAAKAGWTPKGSNLRNRLSELSQAGLVEYPRTGVVRLTPAGVAAAPAPDLGETLIDSIRAVLTGPQRGIFGVLLQHPGRALSRPAIAGLVGWEASGSNLRNRLSELSRLELIEYPGRGDVRLQEWVQ